MRKVTGIAVGLLLAVGAAPALAWEPTKPVEIVVAAGAGGASDQMARMMQAAIQLMTEAGFVTQWAFAFPPCSARRQITKSAARDHVQHRY